MNHKPFTQMFRRGTACVRLALVPMLLAVALGIQPVPLAHAATPIYVRPDGHDTNCDGTTNDPYPGTGGPGLNCAVKTITQGIALVDAGGTVNVAAGTYTEAGINVNKNLTITGAGAATTIVQAHANYNSASNRVFTIADGVSATVAHMTIRHGKGAGSGGGFRVEGGLTLNNSVVTRNVAANEGRGGGIYLYYGGLTTNNSTISNNYASFAGGGIYYDQYGVTLNNSTVSGNTAMEGGGIYHYAGVSTLNNSTVSGNRATSHGGGLKIQWSGIMTLNHATITNNTATYHGGGLTGVATWNYKNSIIAGNRLDSGAANDCSYGPFNSQGYNVLGSGTGCTVGGTDQTTADPKLGLLDLNGGPVGGGGGPKTHALLDGSPALDLVPNGTNGCGTTYITDQRGKTRPVDVLGGGAKCDAGAFERQSDEKTAENSSWTQGQQHVFGGDVNVKMTPNTGDDPGKVTILKRSEWPGGSQDSGEFQILWTLTAANAIYNLDLVLCYTEAELTASGVTDENAITAYRWDEDTWAWVAQTTTPDPPNNCVTAVGVTALSPWTITGGGPPTAVTLQSFSARPAAAPLSSALLLALVALAAGGLVAARRASRAD